MHIPGYVRLTIIGIFLIFIFSIAVIPAYAINLKSVVGLWLLNDNKDAVAKDLSGNGHDGIIKGTKLDKGKFGNCLKFNGSGDFVSFGNAEALNLGVFTVSFWAMFPAIQSWNHIVSKGSHVASGTPGSVNWGVMMYDQAATFLFEVYTDTAWSGIVSPVVPLNEWQHLVATYSGDKMEFFLNGASIGIVATGVKIKLDANRNFRIGGIATAGANPDNYFNGSLDELALFNAVLTLDDIQALMNKGITDTIKINPVEPAGKDATTWAEIKSRY